MKKVIFFCIGMSLLLSVAAASAADDVWPIMVWATQNDGATWWNTNEFTKGSCNSSGTCTMYTVDDASFPSNSIDGIYVQFTWDTNRVDQITSLRFWRSDINGWDPGFSWDYLQFIPSSSWLIGEMDELSNSYIGRGNPNCPSEAKQNNKMMRIDYIDVNDVEKSVIIRGSGFCCGC